MIKEDTKISTKVLGYMMTGYKHGKDSTKYNIEVNQGMNTWNVKRSFAEFTDLHKKLKKVSKNLPKMPKKKLFKVVKSEQLEQRKENLDAYLQDLVKIEEVQSDLNYIQFLDLQSKYSSFSVNDLNLVGYITLKNKGFKDIKISTGHNLFFGICGDSKENFISKNIALTTQDSAAQAGAIECWIHDGSEKIDSYQFLWSMKPKHRARCLDYNEELRLLVVGCEGGYVIGYKINLDNNSSFSEEFNIHAHNRKSFHYFHERIFQPCGDYSCGN